ncbi:hypothetical protein EVAR_36356_1 [Eumeta japonica]|uniref:Uncharacterized protein n=1 Tax=Eumeta variegata TaxID=151549 RepID=A0A4C1W8B9_EUMVA|nr:hypothetical protein EVAR_36356_1 [Eumeta japonica]
MKVLTRVPAIDIRGAQNINIRLCARGDAKDSGTNTAEPLEGTHPPRPANSSLKIRSKSKRYRERIGRVQRAREEAGTCSARPRPPAHADNIGALCVAVPPARTLPRRRIRHSSKAIRLMVFTPF